jgi:hypothetical protein
MAEIDKSTNDFCRDKDGNLDNYSDIWIECHGNCRIFHFGGNVLQFYSPSLGRGHNILKEIYNSIIGSCDKFIKISTYQDKGGNNKESKIFDYESMYSELLNNGTIFDIEETDTEVLFKFKAKDFDKLEKNIKPKTNNTGRSPFSSKNLYHKKYVIPANEINAYKLIISNISIKNISLLNLCNNKFIEKLKSDKQCIYYNKDIKKMIKFSGLKFKEFIHINGMFDKYLLFLQKELYKK